MATDWRIRYVLLSLIWGLSFMFMTIGVQVLAPLQVSLTRLALGALTLLAIMAIRRERLPRERRMWGHLVVVGVTYNALPFTLLSFAATLMPSALSGIVLVTTPLFTLLLAVMFLPAERPTPTRLAGIVIGFAGVVVVMGGPKAWADVAAGTIGPVVLGMSMGLAAAASYGVASVYTRRYLTDSGHSAASLAAGQVLIGAALIGLVTPPLTTMPSELPLRVVMSMLALGVLGTGAAYLLFYSLVRDVGATMASTVTYLMPVIAVAAGAVVLGERLTWYQLLGAGVVLLGAVMAQRQARGGRRTIPADHPDTDQPAAAADVSPSRVDGYDSSAKASSPASASPGASAAASGASPVGPASPSTPSS